MAEHLAETKAFVENVREQNPGEPEFHQAVAEVAHAVMPIVLENRAYRESSVLERLVEPDRVIMFRVAWTDDRGAVRVNRGYRVQVNNAIGPYKGGLRFHPSVRLGTLKFLGFEQVFKNALTGLPMGGGKGGSDFDPKGKSDNEVMRFCQSFMTELVRHVGADRDVPAGDIGVGGREIGYLFGQFKRLTAEYTGVLTGKAPGWGGSLMRTEATGYGCVYFAVLALERAGIGLAGARVAVSGSGNVAIYAAEKAMRLGARVVTLSDSAGTIHDPAGLTEEKLAFVKDLKEVRRGRIAEYATRFGCEYLDGADPWGLPCDIAMPCATQNELDAAGAQRLIRHGVKLIAEGANMPTTAEAVAALQAAGVIVCPAKAANAGGVSVSGLEMSQNSLRLAWTAEEVDQRLAGIMRDIHARCVAHGAGPRGVDYVKGANIAGFIKVADAMVAQGIC